MALALTELNAFVLNMLVPKTTDVIYKGSPAFTRLRTKNAQRFQGGIQIQRPLIVGELNGDAVGRGEAFNIDAVVTDTALVNNMKLYAVNISLYGFDSMQNDGAASAFGQVESKFVNAGLKMAKLLATNMWLNEIGARAKHISGLQQWYDNGNLFPLVGGITRSDIVANGTVGGLNAYTNTLATTMQLRDLNSAYGQSWFGPDHVDLIVLTRNAWDMIWEAMQPSQRYNDISGTDVAQAGFQAMRFNAAELVVDQYLPTGANGTIFGLNTNYIEWYFSTNPKFQFGFTGFKEAANSIDVAGQFLVGNQMVVPNPRSGFKLLSTLF